MQVWTPLTGDTSEEALGLYLNPDWYASNQSNPSSTESFTQRISWWNCADCSIPPFTLGCVSARRCKVPINQIWCHFLQFSQDPRQALNRKQWFIFSFPPLSALQGSGMLLCSCHASLERWLLWPEDGVISVLLSLPFVRSSFKVPRTTAIVRYLLKLAVRQNTVISENRAQLSKCFFTWINSGRSWSCWWNTSTDALAGSECFGVLKQAPGCVNVCSLVDPIARFPKN